MKGKVIQKFKDNILLNSENAMQKNLLQFFINLDKTNPESVNLKFLRLEKVHE